MQVHTHGQICTLPDTNTPKSTPGKHAKTPKSTSGTRSHTHTHTQQGTHLVHAHTRTHTRTHTHTNEHNWYTHTHQRTHLVHVHVGHSGHGTIFLIIWGVALSQHTDLWTWLCVLVCARMCVYVHVSMCVHTSEDCHLRHPKIRLVTLVLPLLLFGEAPVMGRSP